MKSLSALVKLTGTAALATLLATSAFADSRHQDTTNRYNSNDRSQSDNYSGGHRENERISLQGKITSFSRENSGYRVRIDNRNESFWVPDSYVRNRTRDLRIGVNISLGGVWRGGSVYVDAVTWPDAYNNGYNNAYNNDFVRGVVDRVDFRRSTVWLREDRSNRMIEVNVRNGRRGRLGIDDLRRGDRIELSGGWTRNGLFVADRIESVRSGRY